jgi:hypothetical protein
MFSKSRIMGVNGRSINVQSHTPQQSLVARAARSYNAGESHQVTANLGSGAIGPASSSIQGYWASSYQYWTTGIIPADPHLIDTSTLALFYRDIYFFDNVAGACVDIKARFPFSKFDLRGLEDKEMEPFHDALEQLNLGQMMPLIASAHMIDGFFCGSLVFDARAKRFLDVLMHDALSCAVIPSPFYNIDPTINVRVGQATQQFMHDTSEYARRYLNSMPSQFIDMLRSGAFTLDPVTTLFVPRRSTTDRAYTSYLHRILPTYLIEKTLFRGTLVEAQRRQRAMTHLTAGDDTWTPTGEELLALVEQFQAAEYDPLGGWVSTRNAVQAVDLRPGGDFWKWTDMSDILTPYKLRALGVSEALLSGDASFAAAESAYSTFLETCNADREDLTERVFDWKIFPLVAVTNNLYKDPSKRARHNEVVDFLFNRNNRANLKMPQIHWRKSLEAKGEENMAELLQMASDHNIPIPIKMWLAATHIEPEELLRDLEEDKMLRKKLEAFTGKDMSYEAEQELQDKRNGGGEMGGDMGGEDSEFNDEDERGTVGDRDGRTEAHVHSGPITSQALKHLIQNPKKPLLAREFGDGADSFQLTKTGKIRHVPSAASVDRRKRMDDMTMKIARKADKDPNYRENLKRRNAQVLGKTRIK